MLSFLIYELRSRRGGIIGWGLGVSFFIVMYSAFYPSLPTEFIEVDLMESEMYRALGQFDMRSFEAYFSSTILNFMILLVAIYAVTNGTGTLAGEEENGTLELLVTLPLKRWQIVISKAVAMMIAAVLILLMMLVASVVALFIVNSQIETSLTAGDMVLPVLNGWPIIFALMMINLFLGAFMPQRRYALAVGAVVVVAGYLGNNLLPMIEGMDAVTALLPFHYYQIGPDTFTEGINIGDALVLVAAGIVFLGLAVVSFSQRDLTTGIWLWRRAKTA